MRFSQALDMLLTGEAAGIARDVHTNFVLIDKGHSGELHLCRYSPKTDTVKRYTPTEREIFATDWYVVTSNANILE